ncbi:acyl-CoA dehydrogenase family protein [Streptomyces sp. NPDC002306]
MTLLTLQHKAPARTCATVFTPCALPGDPPHVTPTDAAPGADTGTHSATAGELSRLLFDRDERERVHGPWRNLIADEAFRARPGLSVAERTALSYERLRLVNQTVDSAEELADDPRRLAALIEWSAVVDSGLGTLSAIHYNLFLGSLLDHDSRHRDLSAFHTLDRTGTFLCTEVEHGNDAAALETTATLDPTTGGFTLHTPTPGAGKFMPNTSPIGGPKSALVAARLLIDGRDEGIFLFLVPLSDEHGTLPGIRVQPLPERGGTPVDHCLTTFDHVRLPRTALLQGAHGRLDDDDHLHSTLGNRRKRFLSSIGRVTLGKLCMSGAAVGVSRTALAIAVRYAHTRHISGPKAGQRIPLAAHRSHSGRLLYALATTYAMTFLHRTALTAWTDHAPADQAAAERLVAITKAWTTWQARDIVTESRERCGARGLFTANRLTEIMTDLEGTITAEGDNLVIWLKAAAEMIFGHEPAPHLTVQTDERPLTDPYFLRDLLAHTETIWQQRARTALRQGPAKDPVTRWNNTSAPALNMVSAHATLQAADAFLAAIEHTEDPGTRQLLNRLCQLFLLKELIPHTGDLLAANHLTPQHLHALHTTIDTLIHQLTPHMRTLVDAFDLPGQVLADIPLLNDTPAWPAADDQSPLTATLPHHPAAPAQQAFHLATP